VGAVLGLAVAKDAGALCHKLIPRGQNIVDLVADMVHAAGGRAFEELGDGGAFAIRLQQFDLGVGQLHEHHCHAVIRQNL